MDMQIVSATDVQRNYRKVVNKVKASNKPTVVVAGSEPEIVLLPYNKYQDYFDLQKEISKYKVLAMLDEIYEKNKHISDEELDRDIKEALHAAGRD